MFSHQLEHFSLGHPFPRSFEKKSSSLLYWGGGGRIRVH